MALIARLRGERRVLRGGLANQPRLPDIVRERLLTVDVFAVCQRQIGGECMGVLGGADHDGIEVVRVVEYPAEIIVFLSFREPLSRSIHGILVDIAEDRNVLGRNTCGSSGRSVARAAPAAAIAVHVREGTAAAGDHRDVQLVVEVQGPQKGRRTRDHAGSSQGAADHLAAGNLTLLRVFGDLFLHRVLLLGTTGTSTT